MGGHHADDAGLQAQRVARGDQAADARTHTDRHVDFVKVGQRGEQLQAVAGDPGHQPGMERRNQVQAFVPGALGGVFAGGLEVLAMLDQLRAEAAHRRVLLAAVAVRHDDDRLDAVAARREGHRLAVVAAGGADHAGRPLTLVRQVVEIHQAAAQLEGPTGRWFSCFIHTSQPSASHSSGQRICGVGGRLWWTMAAACWREAREKACVVSPCWWSDQPRERTAD